MVNFEQYEKKIDELRAALNRYAEAFKSPNVHVDDKEIRPYLKTTIEAVKRAHVKTHLRMWDAEALAYTFLNPMTREDWDFWMDDSPRDATREIEDIDDAVREVNHAVDVLAWFTFPDEDEEEEDE